MDDLLPTVLITRDVLYRDVVDAFRNIGLLSIAAEISVCIGLIPSSLCAAYLLVSENEEPFTERAVVVRSNLIENPEVRSCGVVGKALLADACDEVALLAGWS